MYWQNDPSIKQAFLNLNMMTHLTNILSHNYQLVYIYPESYGYQLFIITNSAPPWQQSGTLVSFFIIIFSKIGLFERLWKTQVKSEENRREQSFNKVKTQAIKLQC